MADDDFGEERQQLYQRIATLQSLNERMVRAYAEEGLNEIALDCAERIENMFAVGGRTRIQRLASIQVEIRETMRENLTGTAHWNPGSLPNVGKS